MEKIATHIDVVHIYNLPIKPSHQATIPVILTMLHAYAN